MLYVNRVKLRNFKSFKYADIPLDKGFVCFAGPNGSGKSNVIDGLRFAFGELSLKSLRARRQHELITMGSEKAEITVCLDGDRKYEVKRAIRKDGNDCKSLYKLNGKRVTRSVLIDAFRPYGLEEGSHHIIAQGQVQHFIEMNAKERRGVIDQIAGVAEFEQKKAESLKELEKVEFKINDASIVMKEREGYLTQLEKEKDDALKFIAARDSHKVSKASLLHISLDLVDHDHTCISEKYLKLKSEEDNKKKAADEMDAQIKKLEDEKFSLVKEINEKAEREHGGLNSEISSLKSSIAVSTSTKSAKDQDMERLAQRRKALVGDKSKAEDAAKSFDENASKANFELSSVQSLMDAHTKRKQDAAKGAEAVEAHFSDLRKAQTTALKQLDAKRGEISLVDTELSKAKNRKEMIESQLNQTTLTGISPEDEKRNKLLEEKAALDQDVASLQGDMERLFQREKDLNKKLPEVEKQFLEARDKYSTLAARLATLHETPEMRAVESVLMLRDRGMLKGVHGTVAELCKFPEGLTTAVEASAGNRMNFMVVDDVDTAAKAIEYLKERKLGRCTFIPLDKRPYVFSQESRELSKKKGCEGFLLHQIEFNSMLSPAFDYVFGDTLLVDSVASAKGIGVGRIRMVTSGGELFESSGVVTGGTFTKKTGFREKADAERLKKEMDVLKTEKDMVFSTLQSIREEMNGKRPERSRIEVQLKVIEIELKHLSEGQEAAKAAREEAAKAHRTLRAQIGECALLISKGDSELARLRAEAKSFEVRLNQILDELDATKDTDEKKKASEADKQLASLEKKKSDLSAKVAGITAEAEVNRNRIAEVENELKSLKTSEAGLKKEITEFETLITSNSNLLCEREEKLKSLSGALQGLYDRRNGLDKQIDELATERGKRFRGFERSIKQLAELEAQKQMLETRLADLKSEAANFADVQAIEGTKEDFEARIRECETIMSTLGNVNLLAPQAYEDTRRSINEVKERVLKLAEEKMAVVRMIEEIDTRKKEVFMETFHKLNDNFRRLYSHTVTGDATFILENPASPFEGGLSIRVTEASKHEKYLDGMSGGEKALLSVLFVFAIQMSKPAPFYVLDEADAALDKANSLKLSNLLKELSKTTQFIVITHNDQVLAAADIALGVTKTPHGSRIVGLELKKAESAAQAAPAPVTSPTPASAVMEVGAKA